MVNVAVKGNKTQSKSKMPFKTKTPSTPKTPKKIAETTSKSPQKHAKSSVSVSRKRGQDKREKEDDEDVVIKKAKKTVTLTKEKLAALVEDNSESDEEESEESEREEDKADDKEDGKEAEVDEEGEEAVADDASEEDEEDEDVSKKATKQLTGKEQTALVEVKSESESDDDDECEEDEADDEVAEEDEADGEVADDDEADVKVEGEVAEEDEEVEEDADDQNVNDSDSEDDENVDDASDGEGDSEKSDDESEHEEAETQIPQIRVEGYPQYAELRAHFEVCGAITDCKYFFDKAKNAPYCLILFKELNSAKCAVASMNETRLGARTIQVALSKDKSSFKRSFSSKECVTLSNLPPAQDETFCTQLEQHVSKRFGIVEVVSLESNPSMACIQFQKKRSVAAALHARSSNFQGKDIKIHPYSTPANRVLLFGITSALEEKDVEKVMSAHCTVVTTIFSTDAVTGDRTPYALVGLKDEKDVDKLLAMETIKIKDVVVDILPTPHSKHYYNRDTNIYYRHPACVFVEIISKPIPETDLWKVFSRFGPIDEIKILVKGQTAIVLFFDKASAEKALQCDVYEVHNMKIKVHAVDGVYKVNLCERDVGTKLYISNIPDKSDMNEVRAKVKEIVKDFRSNALYDRLTKEFMNAIIFTFENEDLAQQVLDAKIELTNQTVLLVEKYDPTKHDNVLDEKIVLVERLNENTTEIDLWKCFQTFGEIVKTGILRSTGEVHGYVQFATVDIARKALNASTVFINGVQAPIVKLTREFIDKISNRINLPESGNFRGRGRFSSNRGNVNRGSSGLMKGGRNLSNRGSGRGLPFAGGRHLSNRASGRGASFSNGRGDFSSRGSGRGLFSNGRNFSNRGRRGRGSPFSNNMSF